MVLEAVMREELDALIGVGWGECSPKRKGYRNGSYTRDLVTSSGRIEEIKVPRAGLEATSFQHRPGAVWYSEQVQTVRPSNTAMATISMRNDARFDTDQTSTASRR